MDMSMIDKMSHADLKKYVEFLLWHYRVIDGFWFLFVSDDFDQQAAEKINERVWAKAGELAARDFQKRFQIENGLTGFVKALKLFPAGGAKEEGVAGIFMQGDAPWGV